MGPKPVSRWLSPVVFPALFTPFAEDLSSLNSPSTSESLAQTEETILQVQRLRRRQVLSVAIGNFAAILALVGVAMNSQVLLIGGGVLFAGCFVSILFWGFAASRVARKGNGKIT